MYNPCLECFSKYGRTYSLECDKMCDYAKAVRACHEWHFVFDNMYQLTKNNTELIKKNTALLKALCEKEVAADGK